MPRSSRHKSHRQSKHSSKDAREYSDSEEDVKMKDLNGKEEGSARVSRNSGSSEKRKDPPGHSNGDASEDYAGSKRRKEKADVSAASDRWNGGGGNSATVENELKGESSKIDVDKTSKSKTVSDSKSKSGRTHDSGVEKKEDSKGAIKVDSKRKYEKESGRKDVQQHKDSRESKEKEKEKEKDKVLEKERERKAQDSKGDIEVEVVDIEDGSKDSVGFGEVPEGRRGRENNVWPVKDEIRNPESEKELEKRTRRRDGSSEKDKYQDDVRGSGDRRLSLRGERAKDGKYKDEKHKDGSLGDKYRDDGDRGEKHSEDIERERRYRDTKYREGGEKEYRHKDNKYREDVDRDKRLRDDKYREGGDRDNRHRDGKYREDGDKDYRRRSDKYHEDGDRDDRHRDDRCLEDGSRDGRNREEKNWEDAGRDSRRREGKQRDDSVKDKRLRDVKYFEERFSRDGTSDKSDTRRSRDESDAAELRHKKSMNRDGSPNFDDRCTRYKDDKGKRRTDEKEDHDDIRSRSIKEQHLDIEKKSMSSVRVELVGNRGRSSLRDTDVDISPNHSRRGGSPNYRLLKQEESRYRDYMHGGRERRDVTPSKEYSGVSRVTEKSHSIDKSLQKDDGHGDDASTERRLKEDAQVSTFQVVDKSPSSTSNERRHLKRSDVRRSLDVEDSGQRSGGSRETKEHYGRESRGNRELPIETLPGDEFPQGDGDNLSVSSPFIKSSHFNNNTRSLLPPTPFRVGPDRSFEDEHRGKSNRRRRMDPNIGRAQGNAWRGVPNWPSPVANGFVPFQHGPPPLGFHPVMQQFPAPSIFGVRPSMELNQSGVPYHVHDGDRFSGHGRPLGWDGNNSIFGDESHIYGRLDWDHNRSLNSGRGWETSRDMWKGQNSGMSTELSSAPQKDDFPAHGPRDEDWPAQSGLQAQTDKKQPSVQVECIDIARPSDVIERSTPEAPKAILGDISDPKAKDDDLLSRSYLSMLDISEDLSQPEIFSQYTNLMGVVQNADPVENHSKLLIMGEDIDASGKDPYKSSSASLFCAMNDSIFQRAMSLYKKLKDDVNATGREKVPSLIAENVVSALPLDQEGAILNDELPVEVIPTLGQKEAEITVSDLCKVKIVACSEITDDKMDKQVRAEGGEKSDERTAALDEEKMEMEPVLKEKIMDYIAEGRSSFSKDVELSHALSPGKNKEVNEGQNVIDGKCVASCEAGVEELIESGSVNLSRIHQSPESTH